MKIEINLDLDRLQWVGAVGVLLACASCVPSPRIASAVAPPAKVSAPSVAEAEDLDPASREQFARKVSELLVPVSNNPAEPFSDSSQSAEDRQRSLDCLTAAVYYEARSEPEDGQRAVAQVVLNRVRHPAFPSSVCGVVYQGHQRTTGCQFSFTCDGSMNRRRDPLAWERSRRIAEEALGGYVYAAVGNATHYHTTAIRPYWASHLQTSATVGSHIFYRWAGDAGEASAFRQHYGGLEPAPATWNSTGEMSVGGVTIHRGTTPDQQTADISAVQQEVALEGSASVTIHRGPVAEAPAASVTETAPTLQRDAAQEMKSIPGVRVHVGTPPEIG